MLDLRTLFNREQMVKRLKNAKPLATVVMDEVFTDRPQFASPTVPVEDVSMAVRSMPLIQRGGASIAMQTGGASITGYEPLSISINLPVSASTFNDLKQYDEQGLDAWATAKTETLRRTVRNTTEGMAAQALSGKIEWPIQLAGGGIDKYTVNWGTPIAVTIAKKLDAAGATLADVVKLLTNLKKELRRKGYGSGQVKVWAGEDAFNAIIILVGQYTGQQIRVELKDGSVIVAGVEITLRNEEYPHPTQKNTFVPIMPKNAVRMMDVIGGGHQMPYCALDDFDAKLAPLPLFIKPIKQDDPSGYKLVAMSKPFPVPNMDAIAECEVVSN